MYTTPKHYIYFKNSPSNLSISSTVNLKSWPTRISKSRAHLWLEGTRSAFLILLTYSNSPFLNVHFPVTTSSHSSANLFRTCSTNLGSSSLDFNFSAFSIIKLESLMKTIDEFPPRMNFFIFAVIFIISPHGVKKEFTGNALKRVQYARLIVKKRIHAKCNCFCVFVGILINEENVTTAEIFRPESVSFKKFRGNHCGFSSGDYIVRPAIFLYKGHALFRSRN